MDDFGAPLGPGSPAYTHALRQRARSEFRTFYATASSDDAALMDTLLILHAALEEAVTTTHRSRLPWPARVAFERMCNETEQAFMEARDRVHHCFGFQRLSLAEQTRIVVRVFDVRIHMAS